MKMSNMPAAGSCESRGCVGYDTVYNYTYCEFIQDC